MPGAEPTPKPIAVLWCDEHLVVVDKPARCLVVPAPQRSGTTLVDRLTRQLGARVYAVHRLDEDTTGVIALARSEAARAALEPQFRAHEAERVYLALVARAPSPPAGRIESRLAEGSDGVVRSVTTGAGERAVTLYRTLARREDGVLLECRLETGRRNQIRAHLAELGCPIVGDRKYGWRAKAGRRNHPRPLLHAWRLTLVHPVSGERLELTAPPAEPELTPS
ncbi:MAG: RluA family pseudouridine synthase [Planctomycetes bacterium]|nr:RluA family pseudouridine synthase [Planctomycetota bacterium]